MNTKISPIIIIGSHRSGTSMITDFLNKLGLFIGWHLEENYEAVFFKEINDKILNVCNASWDNPYPVQNLFNNELFVNGIKDLIVQDIKSHSVISYIGPKNYFKQKSLISFDTQWGWKDPRNTVLLPLWLEIFPEAKIIHIIRNGIDVSNSLVTREVRRFEKIKKGDIDYEFKLSKQLPEFLNLGLTNFIKKKFYGLKYKMDPLKKYEKYRINNCLSLEKGFRIWSEYLNIANIHLKEIKNNVFTLRFEDFIQKPDQYLEDLTIFCNLSINFDTIKQITKVIKNNRMYAFTQEQEKIEFYQKKIKDKNMIKYNYNNILETSEIL